MAEVKITSENFETEIKQYKGTAIVDFWAEWCGPCRMLAPVLSEIEKELGDSVKVCKVNIDEEPGLAQAYGITAIPAVIKFTDGEKTGSVIGFQTKESIISMLGL